jgi:adenylosuccinate synthase
MTKQAVVVLGLGFGDCGKGSIVDAVAREINATLVVRFNGGPQAAHRVVAANGLAHVFSQFGAGTLAGAATFISKYCFIDPFAFENEAYALEAIGYVTPFVAPGVWIDGEAPVITPFHRAYNRLLEWSRGDQRHGSCGMGVGALAEDLNADGPFVIRAKHLQYETTTGDLLLGIYEQKREAVERLRPLLPKDVLDVDTELDLFRPFDTYAKGRMERWIERYFRFSFKPTILTRPVTFGAHGTVVFEGAQGVLLDETHGFAPYHTWSNCTPANAVSLLEEADDKRPVTVIGVTRCYATRHGVGPFPTEDQRLGAQLREASNHTHPYQGEFRVGHLDAVLLRYAIAACGGQIHGLAVTHLDAPLKRLALATRYEEKVCLPLGTPACKLAEYRPHYRAYLGEHGMDNLLRGIELETQRPILVESLGETAFHKRFTPAWRELMAGKAVSA